MTDVVKVAPGVEEVSCDGGEQFGHPLVYLTLGDDGVVECYYCGRRFVRESENQASGKSNAA